MGLIDKFKNLFTEEIEVEEPERPEKKKNEKEIKKVKNEGVQKEVIQVEIPSPKKARSDRYEDTLEEPSFELEEPEPQKSEYKFPFFDDNDFESIDVKPKPKEEKRSKAYKKEVYNPPKEEKRIFRPSPIISPVYGILDKGYQKDEYSTKQEGRSSYYSSKEANVDAIRNKAYGGLEADIETTLFGGNRVLFNEDKKPKEIKKIEETPKEEPIIAKDDFDYGAETISEKPRHGKVKDEDLTDLLEEEMDKPVSEEKTKRQPRKISDQELFSMIDSFYEKENK